MIDDILFQRGHIFTRIGGKVADFDEIIADYYFETRLGLKGEVSDSDGSEYSLIDLEGDKFEIAFSVYGNVFDTDDGEQVGFDELIVICTGTIAPETIWEDPIDVLQIETYDIAKVV